MNSTPSAAGTNLKATHTKLDLPPSTLDAERVTLGALLIEPDRYFELATTLRSEVFHDEVHRDIYATIVRLHEERKPVDFITVGDALCEHAKLQAIGGSAYLAQLCENVPTTSHAPRYAELIRDAALKRRLVEAGRRIAAVAADPAIEATDALERAEQQLVALARHGGAGKPRHITDIGAEAFDRYAELHEATDKESLLGMRTGFRDLDHLLTGLQPGHLVIVAARPSMGKTSFALDVARHAAGVQKKNVAIFSLEMSNQELMDRVVAGFLGVDAWKLKKGQLTDVDFQRLGTLMDGLREHPLFIDDDGDTTLVKLRSKARRQQMEHGLDLLIIDYLQLIEVTDRASGENRTQQVSHISRQLKNLARELQCPIIALSQLSRSVEQRNPPIPILSDLRESGSIEQDADSVLMFYRRGAYDEDYEQGLIALRVDLRYIRLGMAKDDLGPFEPEAFADFGSCGVSQAQCSSSSALRCCFFASSCRCALHTSTPRLIARA
ncbi:MAG TPA: replicative DNA helicase [Pirellulales bacterium]|nr:replicative DNA helicase [Pirellulales bacterium]